MMRKLLFAAATVMLCAPQAMANARITVLMNVLKIPDAVDILRQEGFAYSEDLDDDLLGGQGGSFWYGQIRQIYASDPITEKLRSALEKGLTAKQVDAAIEFFGSPQGTQIIDFENAARRAMADLEVEEAAHDIFVTLRAENDPFALWITEFITANDLLDRNVSGAMSANMHFYMGLADGNFTEETEASIIEEVWSQQQGIIDDTEAWLNSFLLMAYQPLPEHTRQEYMDYSVSLEGQALNAALFEGFETVYREVSYALGRAVALNADGDEI